MLTQSLAHADSLKNRALTHTAGWSAHAKVIGKGDTLGEVLELMGASISFARNEEIYGEDEQAEFIYRVTRGAVRTYKLLNDGRRQSATFTAEFSMPPTYLRRPWRGSSIHCGSPPRSATIL